MPTPLPTNTNLLNTLIAFLAIRGATRRRPTTRQTHTARQIYDPRTQRIITLHTVTETLTREL